MTTGTSVEPPTISTHPPAGPVVITSRTPDLRVMRLFNPVIRALLRSPLQGLLSEQILLLTYSGRRSGRSYTLPVGYVRDGDALLVVSQHSEVKQWWRNLRSGALVSLLLRGHRLDGCADVIEESDAVATEVERLIARLGAKEASRQLYMGLDLVPPPTREQLAQALKGVVIVRITPPPVAQRRRCSPRCGKETNMSNNLLTKDVSEPLNGATAANIEITPAPVI